MMKFFLALILSFSCLLSSAQTRTPNIVLINMDDMGYGDIEPYGMTGVHTPNFNRLAAEGLRMTNFNTAQAVCTASRAALLTGCYPNRIGLSTVFAPHGTHALNTEEETIASLLKKVGYSTALIGKWHLGPRPPYLPPAYGFDTYYGLPGSNDFWHVDYSNYGNIPIYSGLTVVDSIVTREDQDKITTDYTEHAVKFIKDNKKKAFFLYLAHNQPHVPLAVSSKFKGKSSIGLYGDVIMELDWSLGQVLKTLDDLKLAKNTIVIVTSDNGPWIKYGNNGGSSGGLREGKSTAFEGGTRVPCLIRFPGKVPAGSVSGNLMTNMDILPTLCKFAGAPLPTLKYDGIDFSQALINPSMDSPREVFYYYYTKNNLKAIRYKNWKLVFPHPTQTYEMNELGQNREKGKSSTKKVPLALYDLSHDQGERYDVKGSFPEMVKKLSELAEVAREDMGDDLTNRPGKNLRSSITY